jgi:hydrogenase nickel incorporation protein HypB
MQKAKRDAFDLNRNLRIFEISCKTSDGLENWYRWLSGEIESFRKQ